MDLCLSPSSRQAYDCTVVPRDQRGSKLASTVGGIPNGDTPTLVILVGDVAVNHILPDCGALTIGRSPDCDVVVEHPSISRQHAIFHVEDGYAIEDLGSSNGTRVRGESLQPGQRCTLSMGESVDLGATVLVVRRIAHSPLLTHGLFERRLEEASAKSAPWSLVRVHCPASAPDAAVQKCMQEFLVGHTIGLYAPGEYEALICDVPLETVEQAIDELRSALAKLDSGIRMGHACTPADGVTSHALLYVANHRCRPRVVRAKEERRPVVASPVMEELHGMVHRVAVGSISVLLLGETGVGKEIVARAVHDASPRSSKPFLPLNCAALSESLLESELFGHEKGAFTGATSNKTGLLKAADGGTVFLDEVGEMPMGLQVKLLRVLEDKLVTPVGGTRPRLVDVRFVAATNRDLEGEVANGGFREDLLYRLNGVTLKIPPLRERTEEIVPLAEQFAAQSAEEVGRMPPSLTEEAIEGLRSHAWPGNIRELRNAMERAVLFADEAIGSEHLPMTSPAHRADEAMVPTPPPPMVVESAGEAPEKRRILDALAQCGGNQTRAAKLLGISRRTLTRRLTVHGIARPLKDKGSQ